MSSTPLDSRIKWDRILYVWLFIIVIGTATAVVENEPIPVAVQQPEITDFKTELNKEE